MAVRWSAIACAYQQSAMKNSPPNTNTVNSHAQKYYSQAVIDIETSQSEAIGQENYTIASTLLNAFEMLVESENNRVYGINRTCRAFRRCNWDLSAKSVLTDTAEACRSFLLYANMLCQNSRSIQQRESELRYYDFDQDASSSRRSLKDVHWLTRIISLLGSASDPQDYGLLIARFHDWGHRIPATLKPIWWIRTTTNVLPYNLISNDIGAFCQVLFHIGMLLLSPNESPHHTEAIQGIIYHADNP
jgi:hypothetical protein